MMEEWKTHLDTDFGKIEGENFHIDGYVYLSEDGSQTPYRAVQFCNCYIPNDKRKDTEYIDFAESESKQYIEDCSEERAKEIIEWYLKNMEEV